MTPMVRQSEPSFGSGPPIGRATLQSSPPIRLTGYLIAAPFSPIAAGRPQSGAEETPQPCASGHLRRRFEGRVGLKPEPGASHLADDGARRIPRGADERRGAGGRAAGCAVAGSARRDARGDLRASRNDAIELAMPAVIAWSEKL
jgi:hypothetical protein